MREERCLKEYQKNDKKKILVIDDSALMRRVMSDIINATKEYEVVFTAVNGIEGVNFVEKNMDLTAIFCDIHMPQMDGLEFLTVLNRKGISIPVIVFSSIATKDGMETMKALELGALDFLKKPERLLGENNSSYANKVYNILEIASNINKILSVKKVSKTPTQTYYNPKLSGSGKLVAIVSSTGGPKALQTLIKKLPKNLNAPVLIVQHMPVGFTKSLAIRLNDISEIDVKEAENHEVLDKGTVYIAQGGIHLAVKSNTSECRILFDDSPDVFGLKPCGNIMYNSLCDSYYDEIICVVMTGMGSDGTKGILNLSAYKKIYVIGQNESSSVVYGMPKAIFESGMTDEVVALEDIPLAIIKKVGLN